MRRTNGTPAMAAVDPALAALLLKPPQPDHHMAFVRARKGRFTVRGVISAPKALLDHWQANPNGVGVDERFGSVAGEPELVACLGLDKGISLPEAVRRARKKPRKVSPLLADLCRAAHQDPEELLRS